MENTHTLRTVGKTHKDTHKPTEKTNMRYERFWYTPRKRLADRLGKHAATPAAFSLRESREDFYLGVGLPW